MVLDAIKRWRMALDAGERWKLCGALIARIVLATTLLLSASGLIFSPGSGSRLFGIAELLLGAVIAAGWKTRYAAALVLLGTLATISSAMPFHAAAAEIRPATLSLIACSCFLLYFGRNNALKDRPFIDELGGFSHLGLSVTSAMRRDADVEVTIGLENPLFRSLHRRKCVVTFHELSGPTPKKRKEVWYARDDRQPCGSQDKDRRNKSPDGTQITQNESS